MPSPIKNYVCKCFYQKNFYIPAIDKHVEYINDEQFQNEYKPYLSTLGKEHELPNYLDQIHEELNRRKNLGNEILRRQSLIREHYTKLHSDVYILQSKFLDPSFLHLVEKCKEKSVKEEDILPLINIHSIKDRIYSFPIFTPEFCKKFIEEIENFDKSSVPKTRPNSMNKYGISLRELGFEDEFLHPLRIQFLTPICTILFPDWGGDLLDSEKAFVVKYKVGEDVDLSYHYDNSEITYNVSLNHDFQGGDLYFGEMRNETRTSDFVRIKQQYAHCLLHRGQQRHGADPIKSGKRYNLIVWMRSSSIRNSECPMCESKPSLVETLGYGDGYVLTTDQEAKKLEEST